ncbi:MAG: stage II sporulation protein P [Thermaerobacter sp.]|nr:stage II sporulation protein P [Thermaerobacter sp.]
MHRRLRVLRIARLGRQLFWPLALLAVLLLYAGGGAVAPAFATPGNWSRQPPQAVPLPSPTLRYLLGTGVPALGLARPIKAPFGATGARIAAFLDYTIVGIAPHDPTTLFSTAFAGFGFSHRTSAPYGRSLTSWLQQIGGASSPASANKPAPNQILYGHGQPLVAIYATEGLGSYTGRQIPAQSPPPTSRRRSENAIGLAQALAQALGKAGVPTLFANTVNDGEGELGAYLKSAQTVKGLLQAAPSVGLVLDVERPAYPPTTPLRTIGKQKVASIALVVGTSARLPDKNWQENLALAKSLGAYLQQAAPGVFAGIAQSPDRLNQEYSPTILTLDIGGPAATPTQAHRAIAYVVQAIDAYLGGSPLP